MKLNVRMLLKGRSRAALFSWALAGVSFISLYGVMPVLVRAVGEKVAASYLAILSLSGLYQLLDLGISSYVARYIARSSISGAGTMDGGALDLVRAARGYLYIISLIAPAVFMPFMVKLARQDSATDVLALAMLVSAASLAYLLSRLNTAIIEGCGQIERSRYSQLVGMSAALIGQIAVVWLGGGIVGYALAYFLGATLVFLISARMVEQTVAESFACSFNFRETSKMLRNASSVGAANVFSVLQASFLPVIVGQILNDPSRVVVFFYFQRAVTSSSGFALTPFLCTVPKWCRILARANAKWQLSAYRVAVRRNVRYFLLSLLVFLVASAASLSKLNMGVSAYFLLASIFVVELIFGQFSSIVTQMRLAALQGAPVAWLVLGAILGVGLACLGAAFFGFTGFCFGFVAGQFFGYHFRMITYYRRGY